MGTAIKHPMPGRVKPSFVIFDIRALWRSELYPCGTTGRQRVKLRVSRVNVFVSISSPHDYGRPINTHHNSCWFHIGYDWGSSAAQVNVKMWHIMGLHIHGQQGVTYDGLESCPLSHDYYISLFRCRHWQAFSDYLKLITVTRLRQHALFC